MNATAADSVRRQGDGTYRLGYPYAAWVVRLDALGLFPVCSLTYFREEPNQETMKALHGSRFLRLSPLSPTGERLPD